MVMVVLTGRNNEDWSVCTDCYRKKCLVDESIPDYPKNVHYCEDPAKTECCVVDNKGACCEPNETVSR